MLFNLIKVPNSRDKEDNPVTTQVQHMDNKQHKCQEYILKKYVIYKCCKK